MIGIDAITVQFGAVKPLDDLTAAFNAPICGLIGPNGAGKTTLLNVISGFVTPIKGDVRLAGTSLKGLPPVKRIKAGLRRSFQHELVVGELTARNNVMAMADHVSAKGEAARDTDRALAFCGLDAMRNISGRRLNLFQRRQVELAKTLVGGPRVILLDEPCAGLNDSETDAFRTLLQAIHAEYDAQVILIDHDADLIAAACHETLVIDFGHRLAMGPTAEVLQNDDVRRAYLGTM